ncbi:MAG TPA: Sir2 family NAD-dependent protein deacetylase [Arachnia sp.]|nr:Sir2 family NAD-dependent protein deacetylase [Arachnia sp.]HMT86809.1 Sir2 family NAD-dependent protein deacetylase [Arachnia sp.]
MSISSLDDARRVLVLSGAGISTSAGIPDFRGPQGLWTKDPHAERVSTLSWYLADDEVRKAAWRRRAHPAAWSARPTPGHRAVVDLERQGRLRAIVTQNTDGLHQLAGSSPHLVHEIHGSMRRWRCEGCPATGPMEEMLSRLNAGDPDPRCSQCGGVARATVILFEEALDADILNASIDAARDCDAIVAVGTSLGVYPVAGLFPEAVHHGAYGVIVNASPTPYDRIADEVVRGEIDDVLPRLLAGPGA